jgi:ABC-type multidrug transport system fused ATPase/permease subunit
LVAFALVVIVIGVGLELWVPLLLADFVDQALARESLSVLTQIAGTYLVASFVTQGFKALATYLGTSIGWGVSNDLRYASTEHLLTLDTDYFSETSQGALIERVDGDITTIAKVFSHFAVQGISSVLLLGGIFIVLLQRSPIAGLMMAILVVVIVTFMAATRSLAVSAAEEERGISAAVFGFVEERIAAIDDIRANGGGGYVMQRFAPIIRDYYEKAVASWIKRSFIWVGSIGLFSFGGIGAIAVGGWLSLRGSVTIGTTLLMYQYMLKLEEPIEQVTEQLAEFQKSAAGLRRTAELMATKPTVIRTGQGELPSGPLSLEVKDVSYTYDEAEGTVLNQISLSLQPGTRLGLLGRTGGGKSTLTKLVARFFDPSEGSVLLGGIDLREISTDSLRTRVAFVNQDVRLFTGTVRQNVTIFDPTVSDSEVERAVREVGLGPWLDRLPSGIRTQIGLDGTGVSSGEAQLLAFARAYLRDPGLVILDEPSSRVDPATEAMLSKAIDRLTAGRTSIIIAHRLDTVSTADEILILDDGLVVEHGLRAELARTNSRFSAMVDAASAGAFRQGRARP